MALAKPLGKSEDELLTELPFARGQQYLCALALQNGASPVWQDEYTSIEETINEARGILRAALSRSKVTNGDNLPV